MIVAVVSFLHDAQGYDSIVARGSREPDPSKDVVLKIDGKPVSVPQGKPKGQPAYQGSRFSNSEYLVRIMASNQSIEVVDMFVIYRRLSLLLLRWRVFTRKSVERM